MERRRERLADRERAAGNRTSQRITGEKRAVGQEIPWRATAGKWIEREEVPGRGAPGKWIEREAVPRKGAPGKGTAGNRIGSQKNGRKDPAGKGTVRGSGKKRRRFGPRPVLAAAVVLVLILGYAGRGLFRNAMETVSTSAELRSIKNSDQWKEIFANSASYPDALLKDLERNPEMLDYVSGYLGASQTAAGGLTQEEMAESCPLLIQWDKRWGYVPYGSYNVGISGCGPTCLSMMLFHFTRDASLTPDVMAGMAEDGGYYIQGQGTAWSLMTDAAAWYGLSVSQETFPGEFQIKDSLDQGALLICSVGPGDFTDNGHFILITGYDEAGFTVNDPFSYANSSRSWTYEKLSPQVVQTWTYRSY